MTTSVYPNDLGTNEILIKACGHFESARLSNGRVQLMVPNDAIIKTHEFPRGNEAAFYVVRDGRAACVSLYNFFFRKIPLAEIVVGRSRYGLWSEHVRAWSETAALIDIIKYEDFTEEPITAIDKLVKVFGFPNGDPVAPLRSRDSMAEVDGRWITKASDWRAVWTPELDKLFWQLNKDTMAVHYPLEQPLF